MAGIKASPVVLVLLAISCLVLAAQCARSDDEVLLVGGTGLDPLRIESVDAGSLSAGKPSVGRRSLLQYSHLPSVEHRRIDCSNKPGFCNEKGSKGPACCHGKCVNLQTDRYNCGKCGRFVGKNTACCKGHAVNLQYSATNCGKCGFRCPGNQKCQLGFCNYAS